MESWSPRSLSVLTLTLIITTHLSSVEACSPHQTQVTHDAFYAGLDLICQKAVQCNDPEGPATTLRYCQSVGGFLSFGKVLVNSTTNTTVNPDPQVCLDMILDPNEKLNDCDSTNVNANPNIAAIHSVINSWGNWNKGFIANEHLNLQPTPKPYKTSWENYIQCLANDFNGTTLFKEPTKEYVMGNTTNVFDFMTMCIANRTWFDNSMSVRSSAERVVD